MPEANFRLYDLPAEYEAIGDLLEESFGEVTPEIEARLAELEGKWEAKIERIAALIQRKLRLAEGAKAESDRLKKLAESRSRAVTSLKEYVLYNMVAGGKKRIETETFVVRVQANSTPTVSWAGDPSAIPEYLRKPVVIPDPEIDSRKVAALYRAGEVLPEAVTVTFGEHLRIQ